MCNVSMEASPAKPLISRLGEREGGNFLFFWGNGGAKVMVVGFYNTIC